MDPARPQDIKALCLSGMPNSCISRRIYAIILYFTSANSRLSKEEAELVQKETQLLKHRLNRSK